MLELIHQRDELIQPLFGQGQAKERRKVSSHWDLGVGVCQETELWFSTKETDLFCPSKDHVQEWEEWSDWTQ
jgi:hypothetical protein